MLSSLLWSKCHITHCIKCSSSKNKIYYMLWNHRLSELKIYSPPWFPPLTNIKYILIEMQTWYLWLLAIHKCKYFLICNFFVLIGFLSSMLILCPEINAFMITQLLLTPSWIFNYFYFISIIFGLFNYSYKQINLTCCISEVSNIIKSIALFLWIVINKNCNSLFSKDFSSPIICSDFLFYFKQELCYTITQLIIICLLQLYLFFHVIYYFWIRVKIFNEKIYIWVI